MQYNIRLVIQMIIPVYILIVRLGQELLLQVEQLTTLLLAFMLQVKLMLMHLKKGNYIPMTQIHQLQLRIGIPALIG